MKRDFFQGYAKLSEMLLNGKYTKIFQRQHPLFLDEDRPRIIKFTDKRRLFGGREDNPIVGVVSRLTSSQTPSF